MPEMTFLFWLVDLRGSNHDVTLSTQETACTKVQFWCTLMSKAFNCLPKHLAFSWLQSLNVFSGGHRGFTFITAHNIQQTQSKIAYCENQTHQYLYK